MATSPIAIAADYADAMMTARKAKNLLFLLLLLTLLGQAAIFLVLRFHPNLMGTSAVSTDSTAPATQPAGLSVPKLLEWLVALTSFLGIIFAIVLAVVQLLIVMIMLVGRLIGVSRVTSAFIWSLILIALLFPWQSMLTSPTTPSLGVQASPNMDFKLPGVLYTWGEVTHPTLGATFDTTQMRTTQVILRWARFVVWPAVALILLLVIQSKSSRGLRMALGEVEFDVAEGARPA